MANSGTGLKQLCIKPCAQKSKVEQGTVLLTGGRVPTSWTLLQNVDGVHMRWTVVTQGGNTFQCCRNPNKVQ